MPIEDAPWRECSGVAALTPDGRKAAKPKTIVDLLAATAEVADFEFPAVGREAATPAEFD